ncbi:MAG: ABC transporter ATP-binding protein [Rhizomicrobium sp.]
MSDFALQFSGVTKRFGSFTAVNGLDMAFARGKIVGFLGPNGAGKTTSIRMMLGIIPPDEGSIRVLDAPPAAQRDRVGYLPEERGLYKRMPADASIAYLATLKGMAPRAAMARARALLQENGLGKFARTRIDGLSKGMAQKVQLLSAIAHNPDFVILDEPFSGLDPVNQMDMEEVIRALAGNGKTVLFSTHTMEHAERLADTLIILSRGRKLFDGTLEDARRLVPRRAEIGAGGDLSFLADAPQVAALARPRAPGEYWVVDLKEGADGGALLSQCFERGVPLSHFDVAPPSLHDVFVNLVERDRAAA